MTFAGAVFLTAVVAAFAIFIGLLAYGLMVAGERVEAAAPQPAAGAAVPPAHAALSAEAAGSRSRTPPALDEAA